MTWTANMCISVRAPLDTKLSDEVYEMSGIAEERHALITAIENWLALPELMKLLPGAQLPDRCPEPLCNGLKENPGIICLGSGCGTVRCQHPFHGRRKNMLTTTAPHGPIPYSAGAPRNAAIYALGKRLWDKAYVEYQRTGIKPVELMDLAAALAKISYELLPVLRDKEGAPIYATGGIVESKTYTYLVGSHCEPFPLPPSILEELDLKPPVFPTPEDEQTFSESYNPTQKGHADGATLIRRTLGSIGPAHDKGESFTEFQARLKGRRA